MQKLSAQEMERLSVEEFKKKEKIPFILALDNVRSMHNVGSIFRTADAFRIEKILLGGITAQPPHREIQKTALGATESVAWEHHSDLKEAIIQYKTDGYQIYVIEQTRDSVFLNEYHPSKGEKIVVIFGNEVEGVSEELIHLADTVLEIPQFGTKHSFNVAVTAGMVVWDLWNKLESK